VLVIVIESELQSFLGSFNFPFTLFLYFFSTTTIF